MEEEIEEVPVVGKKYKGQTVVNIDEDRSTRPNGMVRIRKAIQLESGMILVEDEFKDNRVIEGEYKELEYKEIPSPRRISAKPKKDGSKRKKITNPPPLLDDDDNDDANKEAEEKARLEAEEASTESL